MKVSLPVILKDEIKGELRHIEFGEKNFELDMSLNAQMRWEQRFPELAQEELTIYSERVSKIEALSAAVIIAKMKVLYCFFDTDLTFAQFLKLFDLSQKEYVEKLTSRIAQVFETISNGASEKN